MLGLDDRISVSVDHHLIEPPDAVVGRLGTMSIDRAPTSVASRSHTRRGAGIEG